MKRFTITLLIFSLLTTLFVSCNVADSPISTETSLDETLTEEETTLSDTDTTALIETESVEQSKPSESTPSETESIETNPVETELPEKDLVLYQSDRVLAEKFNFDDPSTFEAIVKDQGYRYYVFYRLMIQGVSTAESYTIYLDKSYNLLETTTFRQGQYSKYLSDEEFLKKLSDAVELIDKKTAPYTSNPRYSLMEDSGYLCVYFEEIVDIDPPRVDDYGNTSGCNIDHEHIIFLEKICRLPY